MVIYFIVIARIFSELSSSLSAVIGALIIILFIYSCLVNKIHNFRPKFILIKFLIIYIIIYFIWGLLSLYNFGWMMVMPIAYELLRQVALLCFFMLLSNNVLIRDEALAGLLRSILLIYAVIGVYSACIVAAGILPRACWPSAHPNYIGVSYSMLLAYVIIFNYPLIFKIIIGLGLFLGLSATKSLSSLIVLVAIMTSYYIIQKHILKFSMLACIFLAMFFIAGATFWQSRFVEFSDNLRDFAYTWETQPKWNFGDSSKWRIVNWSVLFGLYERRPIVGWGTLAYLVINPLRTEEGPLGGFHPHSEFLKWLVCFGVVGAAILLSSLLYFGIQALREDQQNLVRINAMTLGCLGGPLFGSGFMYYQMIVILIIILCNHKYSTTRNLSGEL